MGTIRVDVVPWLSQALAPSTLGHLRFEVETEASDLRGLLRQLAAGDEAFARLVYDQEQDTVRFPVRIAVNEDLAELAGGLGAKLSAGDIVTFMAAYTGG